ncbi:hypothetical protein CURE108131_06950 [Cupriavidus respiraculi]|uniref:Lipoprotein n=1 Tax=Cupriavidus respiraculi TaxID=195930 RepID=A0ABM8X9L8_9BURK|nr:hypothetical protein [Cupriavidus respiraculi]MBY4949371.1 hypothetical protein [Cupriavidus respiraculi]CAG9176711.1 hypothetical protein LMG21510_03103 [Cupriavidus respiraculi]
MQKALALAPVLLLLAACASQAPTNGEAAAEAAQDAATAQAAVASAQPAEWQMLRQRYTLCTKEKAEAGARGSDNTQKVAAAAMKSCREELEAVRSSFRDYLNAQMVSSHGRASAKQATERMIRDTEDKTRAYLVKHVEYERAVTARR